MDRTPDAKAGVDKEWQKLVDKSCWLEKKVHEYDNVAREAKAKEAKAHFGRIFEICSQKGSELPENSQRLSMRSLRNSGLALHRWRPLRSLTFTEAS